MNPQEPDILPEMITPREGWTASRLSRSAFYRKLRSREIPSVKLGRRVLIRKVDLIRLLTPTEVRAALRVPTKVKGGPDAA